MARRGKRSGTESSSCRAVRLKWVKGMPACDAASGEGSVNDLVLDSFELVSASPSPEPVPDAKLSIAAAALLASIVADAGPIIMTATVPLVHTPLCEREVLAPVPQKRLF